MFAQVYLPETLQHHELDAYLESGWFRMGQTIFTTNFLHFNDKLYSAIWPRIVLNRLEEEDTQQKLFKRNSIFRHVIKKAEITPEKENLFERYRASVTFEASTSLNMLLMGKTATQNVYDTYEIDVYEQDKLIAVGYFDLGDRSAMGITSIYDPMYKKYSLGKYLIYLKIAHCKSLGMEYFYPGYFVPSYSYFDYKLSIGKSALEFLQLKSQQWKHIREFTNDDIPIDMMFAKLRELQDQLEKEKLFGTLFRYELFDANLIPSLSGAELFDYPIFIQYHQRAPEGIGLIIVYDIIDSQYHAIRCFSVWQHPSPSVQAGFYADHLLKISDYVASSSTAVALIEKLRHHSD
jgi:arginyl-tRNA--protein-N-Asp/Glu arginylyltransferase